MNNTERKLFIGYGRAIIHIREQIELKRFGLVFGAGISCQFGFPTWKTLIQQLANHTKINGADLVDISDNVTNISQMLYQKLKSQVSTVRTDSEYDRATSIYKREWLKIIHEELYKNVPEDIYELQQKDKYIKDFLPIIRSTKLTLNYNFDNTIELLLGAERSESEKNTTRGYRTVWDSDIQLYPQDGVIYHPNGFIPKGFRERPSDDIVFLEDSFGDQLLDSIAGHYNALSNFYAQNTCLLIGLSLEDATLKHILRQNARIHPGHVHYYVYYLKDENSLTKKQKEQIINSNFEIYNLITLFLNEQEISVLGQLINTEKEIGVMIDQLGLNSIYRFYLTGSVCVGKSTAVSQFRSLRTHDEWLERKVEGMEKDPNKVNDYEKIKQIDLWVAEQWRNKNYILSQKKSGIHIIDRAPLDAFAFTPENEWVAKAKLTKENITPEKSSTKLCRGKIILLIGDPNEMSVRALRLQKEVSVEDLKHRQKLLKIVYLDSNIGIVELDTRSKSRERVAKEICKIIHLDGYEECDMQDILEKIEKEEIKPN